MPSIEPVWTGETIEPKPFESVWKQKYQELEEEFKSIVEKAGHAETRYKHDLDKMDQKYREACNQLSNVIDERDRLYRENRVQGYKIENLNHSLKTKDEYINSISEENELLRKLVKKWA